MLGFVKSQKKRDVVISQNSRGFMIKKKEKKQKKKKNKNKPPPPKQNRDFVI